MTARHRARRRTGDAVDGALREDEGRPEAAGDPRLSLEERYGDHDGYVRAVTAAANHAVDLGFLLPADRDALIAQAQASTVLNP